MAWSVWAMVPNPCLQLVESWVDPSEWRQVLRRAKETSAFFLPHPAEPVAVHGMAWLSAWKRRGTLCSCCSACCSRAPLCSQNTTEAVLLQRGFHQLLEFSKACCYFYVDLASPLTSGSLLPNNSAASLSSGNLGWISGLIWRQPAAALHSKCPIKQLIISL